MNLRIFAVISVTLIFSGDFLRAGMIVYSNDFDGNETSPASVTETFAGVFSIESVQGYDGLGNGGNIFSGNLLRNDSPDRPNIDPHQGPAGVPASPTILTITGLPAHTSVDLDFLLAIIDSWDGLGPSLSQPDLFNVRVDGQLVFSHYFSEINGSTRIQDYVAPANGVLAVNTQLGFTLGFNADDFTDAAYDMYLDPALSSIPHTASDITIEWFASGAGYEGGISESWAIDNIVVSVNAVPEPSSIVLWLLGFATISVFKKRELATADKS